MKQSQLKQIVREEVRRVLKEAAGTQLMSDPTIAQKVNMVIQTLKSIDVDGETMEYILHQVGMSDQMKSQLSNM